MALAEIENLSRVNLVSSAVAVQCRRFSLLFEEAKNHLIQSFDRKGRIGWIENAADGVTGDLQCELMELAVAIVALAGISGPIHGRLFKRSFFLNLERPFERAVRQCLRRLPSVRFVKNGRKDPFNMTLVGEQFKANPDLIVGMQSGSLVVGDVKYKDCGASLRPAPSDLYQLLAHTHAADSKVSILVFPGDNFQMLELGNFKPGIRVLACSIRVSHLRDDCESMISQLESKLECFLG